MGSWGAYVSSGPETQGGYMKILNKSSGHISDLVLSLRDSLHRIQRGMQDNPHDPNLGQRELHLNRDYSVALA